VLTRATARISALSENDLKKIIALRTLRQLGIMMIALGIKQPQLAFFHLISHAMFKALLFITAGVIIHIHRNNQDIRLIGNIANISPLNYVFFNTANLSLCGIPFLSGYYSKDTILETIYTQHTHTTTTLLLIIRLFLTAAYSIRIAKYTI